MGIHHFAIGPGSNSPSLTRRKQGGRGTRGDQRRDREGTPGQGLGDTVQGRELGCATPSDLDLIVADAPRAPSGEGSPSRYSIAAWHSVQDGPPEEQPGPIFDLYDAERSVAARVRRVPTPKQAAELLERYGVPGSEARNTAAS